MTLKRYTFCFCSSTFDLYRTLYSFIIRFILLSSDPPFPESGETSAYSSSSSDAISVGLFVGDVTAGLSSDLTDSSLASP